jgi:hypothetical protein
MKLLKAITLLSLITVIISWATINQPKEEKRDNVSLTLMEWQIVTGAIQSPDDITNNQKKLVISKIAYQVNKQLADTLKKK